MILSGSCLNSGVSSLLPYNRNPCNFKTCNLRVSSIHPTHKRVVPSNHRSSIGPLPEIKSSASLGMFSFTKFNYRLRFFNFECIFMSEIYVFKNLFVVIPPFCLRCFLILSNLYLQLILLFSVC